MKIAIATDNKKVSGHFGHCQGFTMYEVEEDRVLNNEFIENPGHRPGFLPRFLKEKNADVIIAGGMGRTAQNLFMENGIEVVVGVEGNCDDVIKGYLKGEIKSTEAVCEEHANEGNCNS